MTATSPRADLYSRVTNRIIAELEKGVRPWFKPWNAEHAAGRITRPLARQRPALQGRQCLDAVGRGCGARLRLPDLDDLQAGAGDSARRCARASMARSSSMPTACAAPRPPTMATRSSAKSRSSKAIRSSIASRSTACPSTSTPSPPSLPAPARIEMAEQFAVHRRCHPPWRQPGFLRDRCRPRANAAV